MASLLISPMILSPVNLFVRSGLRRCCTHQFALAEAPVLREQPCERYIAFFILGVGCALLPRCRRREASCDTRFSGLQFSCPWCGGYNIHSGSPHALPLAGAVVQCQCVKCRKMCRINSELNKKCDTGISVCGAIATAGLGFACPPLGAAVAVVNGAYHVNMGDKQDDCWRQFRGGVSACGGVAEGFELLSAGKAASDMHNLGTLIDTIGATGGAIEGLSNDDPVAVALGTASLAAVGFQHLCDSNLTGAKANTKRVKTSLAKANTTVEDAQQNVADLARQIRKGGPVSKTFQVGEVWTKSLPRAAQETNKLVSARDGIHRLLELKVITESKAANLVQVSRLISKSLDVSDELCSVLDAMSSLQPNVVSEQAPKRQELLEKNTCQVVNAQGAQVNELMDAMRNVPTSSHIQIVALKRIDSLLSLDEASSRELVINNVATTNSILDERSGLELVVQTMALHGDCFMVQDAACMVLARLCKGGGDEHDEVGEQVVESVVHALRGFKCPSGVKGPSGLSVVINMCSGSHVACIIHRDGFVKHGFLEVSASHLKSAASALEEEHVRVVSHRRELEDIANSRRTDFYNPQTTILGVDFFLRAAYRGLRPLFLDEQFHTGSVEEWIRAINVVCKDGNGAGDRRDRASDAGVFEQLAAVLKECQDKESIAVVKECLLAVRTLCACEPGHSPRRARAAWANLICTISKSMRLHGHIPGIAQHGCEAICEICRAGDFATAMERVRVHSRREETIDDVATRGPFWNGFFDLCVKVLILSLENLQRFRAWTSSIKVPVQRKWLSQTALMGRPRAMAASDGQLWWGAGAPTRVPLPDCFDSALTEDPCNFPFAALPASIGDTSIEKHWCYLIYQAATHTMHIVFGRLIRMCIDSMLIYCLLAAASLTPDWTERAVAVGFLEGMADILRDRICHPNIVRHGLRTICCMCLVDDGDYVLRKRAIAIGLLEIIAHILQAHHGNTSVLEEGCVTFAIICGIDVNYTMRFPECDMES